MRIGQEFKLKDEALDNYGEDFRDQVFTVKYVADHYVPAKDYFDPRSPRYQEPGGHP